MTCTMKTIKIFQISFISMIAMNALGDYLFTGNSMSLQSIIILSFAITYCMNEDRKE